MKVNGCFCFVLIVYHQFTSDHIEKKKKFKIVGKSANVRILNEKELKKY